VIHVDWGVVALPRHGPDLAGGSARLGPLCAAILRREGPDRQWSTTELLDLLADEVDLPAWLNPWHLSSMLRSSGEVTALGHLRVALRAVRPGDERDERVFVRELLGEVMREADAPLSEAEILERVRARGAVSDASLRHLLWRPPYIEIAPDRFGLVARDLPGGAEAWTAAAEALAEELTVRGAGLPLVDATALVREATGDAEAWTPEAVRSVARGAPALRLARTDAIGLSAWDDARVPSRVALLRACLDEDGGQTAIQKVQDPIAAVHGSRPRRIAAMLAAAGTRLRGDLLVDRALDDEESPSTPSLDLCTLSGPS
jgi:hypothetical protein